MFYEKSNTSRYFCFYTYVYLEFRADIQRHTAAAAATTTTTTTTIITTTITTTTTTNTTTTTTATINNNKSLFQISIFC